jgi:hypothetical protein
MHRASSRVLQLQRVQQCSAYLWQSDSLLQQRCEENHCVKIHKLTCSDLVTIVSSL